MFRKINKFNLSTLPLENYSPRLLNARDFQLAVPGSYKPGKDIIHIASFDPNVVVLQATQRTRKIEIRGGDGVVYKFFLKGNDFRDPCNSFSQVIMIRGRKNK